MTNNNYHIQVLINKYVAGKASVTDMRQLNTWMEAAPANKKTFTKLKRKAEKREINSGNDDWQRFTHKYNQPLNAPKKHKRIIGFISLAASVSLVIGVSFHTFYRPKSSLLDTQPIQYDETQSQTTLSLTDGTDISLSKEHATIEIEDNGKSILIEETETLTNHDNNTVEAFNQLHVPYGRTAQLTLADGTKVWLNAGSQLVFPSNFSTDTREVLLRGEGFFDVTHHPEKAFKVLTDEMTFTVLGTSFNINSYANKNHVDAVLVDGSLHMANNVVFNKKEIVLEPGEKSSFDLNKKTLQIKKVDTKRYTSWKEGYLTLQRNSLNNLISQIENYYNCSIDIPTDLAHTKIQITGKIILDEDPEQVYKALSDLFNVDYQLINDKVIMTKR